MNVELGKGAGAPDGGGFSHEAALRALALESLKKKSDFRIHLLIYVLVNAMLIMIWAMTGAGYFWPAYPIAGWGIGLIAHAWDVYWKKPPTEDQVQAEMRRLRGAG